MSHQPPVEPARPHDEADRLNRLAFAVLQGRGGCAITFTPEAA